MRYILRHLDTRATPIIGRLANLSARPSPDTTMMLGAIIFVISIGISTGYGYIRTSEAYTPLNHIAHQSVEVLLISAWLHLMLFPPLTAGIAATMAARDIKSESFSLLRLTNISGQALFQGYVITVLYRLRLLSSVVFGLIPLYATGLTARSLLDIVIVNRGGYFTAEDIGLRLAYYTLIGVGLWGMSLFAAVMGVNVGMRARSPILAGSIAPVGVMIVIASVALVLTGYIAPMFSMTVSALYPFAIPLILLAGVVIAILPFAETIRALRYENRPLPTASEI